jgi:membrane fusion protein (multidrug efflux system)
MNMVGRPSQVIGGVVGQFKKRSAFAKTAILLAVFVVFLGGYKFITIYNAIQEGKSFTPPPEAVTSTVAVQTTWRKTISAVGTLVATQGVVLSAEVAGKVARTNFDAGARVQAGAVLVELDTSVEEANLRASQALLVQAQRALERARSLRAKNANSQADLDAATANERVAAANVESLRAGIARMKVTAPFSGVAGIRAVNVGQYLSPGTAVVPLFAMDPIYINFNVPQRSLGELRVSGQVAVIVDAFPQPFIGSITTINPQIDPTTRNVEVQATIPNPSEQLRPGMFARVTADLDQEEQIVAVPVSAIQFAPFGDSVFVVTRSAGEPQGIVRQQIVKLGARRGDLVAVSGVSAGEEIVTSGTFKLRPGAGVLINNQVQPSASIQPNPDDI